MVNTEIEKEGAAALSTLTCIVSFESTQSFGVVKLIEQPGTDVRLVGNPDANSGMHPPAFQRTWMRTSMKA